LLATEGAEEVQLPLSPELAVVVGGRPLLLLVPEVEVAALKNQLENIYKLITYVQQLLSSERAGLVEGQRP
jgi:hypothetical protein